MSTIDRRTFDAIVAEAAPGPEALIALAPLSPLGTLTGAAKQGVLDRRIVTAAAIPLRHTRLGAKSGATRDAFELAEMVDMVWICVTAGQAEALLDAAIPALDAAWLLAGPLGILADGRNPTKVIASRLDPTSPIVASPLFRDLPGVLLELSEGRLDALHRARNEVVQFWGDLVGISVDLSRLKIYSKLSEEELADCAAQAQETLEDNPRHWELAASLSFQWPGSFKELVTAVRTLSDQHPASA